MLVFLAIGAILLLVIYNTGSNNMPVTLDSGNVVPAFLAEKITEREEFQNTQEQIDEAVRHYDNTYKPQYDPETGEVDNSPWINASSEIKPDLLDAGINRSLGSEEENRPIVTMPETFTAITNDLPVTSDPGSIVAPVVDDKADNQPVVREGNKVIIEGIEITTPTRPEVINETVSQPVYEEPQKPQPQPVIRREVTEPVVVEQPRVIKEAEKPIRVATVETVQTSERIRTVTPTTTPTINKRERLINKVD